MSIKEGSFYLCPKSGTVVMVVKEGASSLSTDYGPMIAQASNVADDTLELADADFALTLAAKDTPDRQLSALPLRRFLRTERR